VCSVIMCTYYFAAAQVSDSAKLLRLTELVVSGTKNATTRDKVVQDITTISRARMQLINASATGELLQQSGEVYLQKSQAGGGSPIIRGFEASRVLLVVDGVRLNNAIYRAGHLQNAITVDQNALQSVEVLLGSSSALYGSDALGGVVVMNTLLPKFSTKIGKRYYSSAAMTRYATAISEKSIHGDILVGGARLASVSSITISSFGNVIAGKRRDAKYSGWGQCLYFADVTSSGVDTMLPNAMPHIQKRTGYSQIDLLQKVAYRAKNGVTHTINIQLSNSTSINRYDRLSEYSGSKLKWADWYYGPQRRTFESYSFSKIRKHGLVSKLNLVLAHQHILESRITRRFNSTAKDTRLEKVDVSSIDLNATKQERNYTMTLGVDGQFNAIVSSGTSVNIASNVATAIDSRYPNGTNRMAFASVYAQYLYTPFAKKITLNSGLRVTASSLYSTIADVSTQFNIPYTTIKQRSSAMTGSTAVKYKITKSTALSALYSSGFRMPNIDDMTKIFETAAGNGVVVPNPTIKPERTHQLEFNTQITTDAFDLKAGVYHTWLTNAMVLDKFSFNGADSILYAGSMQRVLAMQNKASGTVYGAFLSFKGDITRLLTYSGNLNLTKGQYFLGSTISPLDHIAPTFGRFAMAYSKAKFTFESYVMFSDLKAAANYSNSGEDNAQFATAVGMPSWHTINCRNTYQCHKLLNVSLGVENILDEHYRLFASGISAPGRNFTLTLRSSL
jgi:hemoglobin/transferrin/lactoferrin receptor protein